MIRNDISHSVVKSLPKSFQNCNCYFVPLLLLFGACWLKTSLAYSVFDCRCCPTWNVTTEDNDITSRRYLNWLSWRQNDCTNNRGLNVNKYSFGYGSSINLSCIDILKALELGAVYRPAYPWLWSSPSEFVNASSLHANTINDGCYSHMDSLDCFNIPLSYCKLNETYGMTPGHFGEPLVNKTDAAALIPGPSDICKQARLTKKSMLWVFGMILHYHMRLPAKTHKVVRDRLMSVFPHGGSPSVKTDPITGKECMTASLHIRAGQPDFGRVALNGQEHYNHLLNYNARLAPSNRIICTVYVSGDHLDQTIFAKYITEEFPKSVNNSRSDEKSVLWPSRLVTAKEGSFLFKFLPHYVFEPGEIEFQVRKIKEHNKLSMEDLYLEFVTDVKVLSAADIFFGSWSNIFIVTDALRNAYRPELPNNSTCFIQSARASKKLECRGGGDVLKIWRDLFGGFLGGGVMYFPEKL